MASTQIEGSMVDWWWQLQRLRWSVVATTASGSNDSVKGYGSMACCPVATTIQGADLSSAMRMVGLDCNHGLKIL
jgi:hypothetical protein